MNFNDLHDKVAKYNTGLIEKEEIEKWLSENIKFETYIPIAKKYSLIHKINEQFSKEVSSIIEEKKDDIEIIYLIYDLTILFDVIFRYTNVVVEKDKRTVENYDFIVNSGVYDYFIKSIGADVFRFISIFERSSGINEINVTSIISGAISKNIKTEDIENLRNLFKGLSAKKIDAINKFAEFNNPAMKNLLDNVKIEAMKQTDETMKNK